MQRRTAAWLAFTVGFTAALLATAWWLRKPANAPLQAGGTGESLVSTPTAK